MNLKELLKAASEAVGFTNDGRPFVVVMTCNGELKKGIYRGWTGTKKTGYSIEIVPPYGQNQHIKVRDIEYFNGLGYENLTEIIMRMLHDADALPERFRELAKREY